ncbi:MAG: Cell division protein FtsA [Syntrophomonadaceae bacterium]|nr:Cell division protein FtsA [Bacillota bacterium]
MLRGSVGLDIGANAIKIVELRKVGEKVQLIKAGMVGIPDDSSRQKDILSNLLRDFKGRGKAFSVAVPGQSAYIRYVDLPPLDTSRLEQMMGYEAKQQIPVPLEEVLWDYQRLPARDPSKTSIVLVAAKSEAIERLLDNIGRFGIEPYAIDYSPLASYNALKFSGSISSETSILIDLGAESTNLSIETRNSLCWTRSIPVGGMSLTRSIEKSLGVTLIEAERLKKEEGGAPGSAGRDRVVEAMAPSLRRLADEIRRSLTFFQAELGGEAVNRVILSGGGVHIKGISQFLKEELGVSVETASPLAALYSPLPIISRDQEAFFHVAIGLALRPLLKCPVEVNLLPPSILKKKEFRAKKAALVISLILAFLSAITFREFFAQDYRMIRSRIEVIEAGLAEYRRHEPEMKIAAKEKEDTREQVEELARLAAERVFLPNLLLELTTMLPEEIHLRSFSLGEEAINIEGVAPRLPLITDFETRIKASPLFGAVTTELAGKPGAHEFSFTININE